MDSFGLFGRSDEYGEGPKGPASTGEEAEMGFEALKVLDKSRSVTDSALIQLGMQHHRHHHCHQSPFESMRYLRLVSNSVSCFAGLADLADALLEPIESN